MVLCDVMSKISRKNKINIDSSEQQKFVLKIIKKRIIQQNIKKCWKKFVSLEIGILHNILAWEVLVLGLRLERPYILTSFFFTKRT